MPRTKEWKPTVDNSMDLARAGDVLKLLREEYNLDESSVKERSGLTSQRIRKIEAGADPSLTELAALATAFSYTTAGLVQKIARANARG